MLTKLTYTLVSRLASNATFQDGLNKELCCLLDVDVVLRGGLKPAYLRTAVRSQEVPYHPINFLPDKRLENLHVDMTINDQGGLFLAELAPLYNIPGLSRDDALWPMCAQVPDMSAGAP